MLKMTHDNPTGAHTGSKKCLEKIRANYWFPNCSKIVEFYTRSCEKCFYVNISYKASPKAVQLPMTASYPNQQVLIDILGPLSRQASYKYIVIYVDKYTKLCNATALTSIKALPVAKAFLNDWCLIYGFAAHLHSDNGKQFISEVLENLCRVCGIDQRFISPYNARANGQVEGYCCIIKNALKKLVQDKPSQWKELMPKVIFGLNTCVNSTTSYAPTELFFAQSVRLPHDLYYGVTTSTFYRDGAHRMVDKFWEMRESFDRALSNGLRRQDVVKRRYDSKACVCTVSTSVTRSERVQEVSFHLDRSFPRYGDPE